MKKSALFIYSAILMVFCVGDVFGVDYSSSKFVNAQKIQDQFASDSKAKVLVVLNESGNVPASVDWTNKSSVLTFQNAVQSLQGAVLSTLSAQEHTARYRYQNFAAFSGSISESGLDKLVANGSVRYIQPVVPVQRATAQGLPLMNAMLTLNTYDGSGVSIAIVDDAIDYTHPNLGGGGFPNAKVIGGYDFGNNDPDPAPVLPGDLQAHGTSVSGVAAGSTDELLEDYIGGAAPGAKIYALKFSNDVDGGLENDGGVASWDWCITHQYDDPDNPIMVISNSWGRPFHTDDEALADAINPAEAMAADRCVAAGMVVVVASGNEYSKNGISLPAANSNTIAVGAVRDTTGVVMDYSNSGNLLDLLAPSDCAYTTDIVGAEGYSDNNWMTCFNGTSCATPYASGMIAVLQQASKVKQGRFLTPSEVLQYLSQSGNPTMDFENSITKPLIDLEAAIMQIPSPVDVSPPTPDPMEWDVEPAAVGLNTIYMEAVEATDSEDNGVEYLFGCVNDPNFDSGWQDEPVYYQGGYTEGRTYEFQVTARDKSENQNETAYSAAVETMTASGTDDLPPMPNPAAWKGKPRKVSNTRIGMEAAEGLDEAADVDGEWESEPVWYYFECVSTTDPAYPDPSVLNRAWDVNPVYVVSGVSVSSPGNIYIFQVQTRDADGNVTDWSEEGKVILAPPPRVLEVPYPYSSIQDAVDAANHGDTVVIHPGTYTGGGNRNIDFGGLAITVRSEDPENPAIVAATIIDCEGTQNASDDYDPVRAFHFESGEGRDSVVDGLTIINGYAVNNPSYTNPTDQDNPNGDNGLDAMGGAILCSNGSSPTLSNCVIRDCYAQGGNGAGGEPGVPGAPGADGDGDAAPGGSGDDGTLGGNGGSGGHGSGGAIYCDFNSRPLIKGCIIDNCYGLGGDAGRGGDGGAGGVGGAGGGGDSDGGAGGAGGDGGLGGNGGNGVGAVYFEAGCEPDIIDCIIRNCIGRNGLGNAGGHGGVGDLGGEATGAGVGGAGGAGGNGGDAGNDGGGFSGAGAIYAGSGSVLTISGTTIDGNIGTLVREDRTIDRYAGGNGGGGGDGAGGGATIGNGGRGGDGGNGGGSIGSGDVDFIGVGGTGGDGGTGDTGGDGGTGGDAGDIAVIGIGGIGGIGVTANGADGSDGEVNGDFFVSSLGGAILLDTNSQITASNSIFENNLCETDDGGAIYAKQGVVSIFTDCDFNTNTAIDDGGAVCLEDPSSASFTDCLFEGNQCGSGEGGGAIGFQEGGASGVLNIADCSFTDNGSSTTEYGGAIWVHNGAFLETHIQDSEFSGNQAVYGGAISIHDSLLTIEKSDFSSNASEFGGAVYASEADLTTEGCSFIQNMAQPLGASSNNACSGGGLYCLNTSLRAYDNTFIENDAQLTGGAIYLVGPFYYVNNGTQDIVNCLMLKNTAGVNGGAVAAMNGAEPFMINCTMVDNAATEAFSFGGAVSFGYDSLSENDDIDLYTYALLENCILWGNGNGTDYGPQAALGDPLDLDNQFITLELSHTDIQGGIDDIFLGKPDGNTWVYEAGGVIDADPLFAAVSAQTDSPKNYYLSQIAAGQLTDSPCVDTGSMTTIAAGLDTYTTRTDHIEDVNEVDMGYHYDIAEPHDNTYTLTLVVDRGSDAPNDTKLRGYSEKGLSQFDVQTYDGPGDTTPYEVKVPVSGGTQVALEAIIDDPFYTIKEWHNTDDDASTAKTNSVRVASDKTVRLELDTTIPMLRTFVRESDGTRIQVPEGDERVSPNGNTLWPEDAVVNLQATPPNASDSVRWLGTDDDTLLGNFNTVTMTGSKDVEVEFYTPTIYDVTGDFTELQYAIDDAKDGDIIILHPGLYDPVQGYQYLIDKNIVIQGYNPDDPETVANTIVRNTFQFSNTNRTMVINGISIQDMHWGGRDGCDGKESDTPCADTEDAGNGSGLGGGGIRFSGNASATVKNCRIVNCSMTGGNGGDGTQDGDGGWGGWAHGGAVYIGSGNPRFINCEFIGNFVRGGGGGDSGDGGAPGRGGSWEDPLDPYLGWDWGPYLEYWKYSGYGGAVYCDEDSEPEFKNCFFSGNIAYGGHTGQGDGGYPRGGYPVEGYYKIDRYGGAVYAAEGSTVLFTECVFEDNQADIEGPLTNYKDENRVPMIEEDPYFAYGGGIAFEDDAVITLNDCVIETGLAHHGGGVYAEYATLQVTDCNVLGNTASFGGGFYYVDTETTVDKTIFSDNTADLGESQGGGIFAFDANSVFTDVVMNGNSSGRSGGGFFATGGNTTVKNALIINNAAVRDGAGFSANWYATVDLQNCTFSMNEVLGTSSGISQGGAIFAGYQSYVDIIDSILWDNSAGQGQQIAVATGFEFDPVPSIVTISYSDVQGNRSASSVFVDEGCTLNWDDTSMIYDDPLFVDPLTDNYHLNQPNAGAPSAPLSPAVDAGSDLASALGLDKYTTTDSDSKFDFDTRIVDQGYHYPLVEGIEHCAYADLSYAALGYQLDGVVDLTDLVVLAGFWLENQCDATDRWCQGSDLNFDGGVDLYDFAFMASCWSVFDFETPFPDPAQWEISPRPVDNTMDEIYMEAVQATDNWIGGVEYYFENQTITDGSHDSGWRQGFDLDRDDLVEFVPEPWIYIDEGLTAGQSYTYTVITRDVADNKTAEATPASAIPGVDNTPPSPDPSEWAGVGEPRQGEPRQTASGTVSMEALQAVDASGVEYLFVCVEDNTLSSGWQQNADAGDPGFVATPWTYEVTGLVLGETYTFYVKTRDRSLAQNETGTSSSISVLIVEIDDQPPHDPGLDPADPLYYTAKHSSGSPYQTFNSGDSRWKHVVEAVVMEDVSGVEYKFVCSNSSFNSGGDWDPDGEEWRNVDNVAGLFYPSGEAQVPERYWADRGVQNAGDEWYIIVRDLSDNQNTAVQSESRTIFDPAPTP